MSESRIAIRPVGQPGDLGWMVQAHGEIYAAEYGWDTSFEALVARIVADFAADPDRPGQRGWIAEIDGRRVGCVLCVPARMTLWTNDPLVSARRIYLSRGFTLVEEDPHQSYGADLVGQVYELDLRRSPTVSRPPM